VSTPPPCRFCGALIARDATADWFATDPGNETPWTCPSNVGGHAPALREQLEARLSSADTRYRNEWRAAQQLPTLGEAHDAALAAERRRQQAWQRAHAAYREAATQSGAGSRGARNQPATQVRDARDATPDWAAPKLDRDPREYGLRAPDGTRWIHVPWQGWQRNDGQPFLQQEADR